MSSPAPSPEYLDRIAKEKAHFSNCTNLHELPQIFHYWSNKFILPKLQAVGWESVPHMFEKSMIQRCAAASSGLRQFVSIGSGKGEMEIQLAKALRAKGHANFRLACVELNSGLIAEGRANAKTVGVSDNIQFVEADFNEWRAAEQYDVVMASHSLHHVMNLEGLFDEIKRSLAPHGQFVTADMIGRNGHMRWPEALDIVQEFWRELPPGHRYNQLLRRHEETYENWDCSMEGFEGIRAQDILPLLVERFHFEKFVAFSNVTGPFVDRAFGHNFDPESEWDRDFIDRVHLRDEQEMLAGRLKPTIMIAAMSNQPMILSQHLGPFSPEFSIRWPNGRQVVHEAETANNDRRLRALENDLAQTQKAMENARWQIEQAANSKWVRLGRSLGLGPKLR